MRTKPPTNQERVLKEMIELDKVMDKFEIAKLTGLTVQQVTTCKRPLKGRALIVLTHRTKPGTYGGPIKDRDLWAINPKARERAIRVVRNAFYGGDSNDNAS